MVNRSAQTQKTPIQATGVIEAEVLTLMNVQKFAPAVLMFYATVAANMRLLSASTAFTAHRIFANADQEGVPFHR